MATTADFKNGLCIVHNNELWSIVEFLHVKPGKGNTFVRTKLKNLKTGRVQEFRFDAGIKIELARVERRPYQFLYKEGDNTYIFMHTETYEQLPIEKELINNPGLLKEGQDVYTFDDIDLGNWSLSHAYGPVLWSGQLTEKELISDEANPKPTVTAKLTLLGEGTKITGTLEMQVIPGPEKGRIEVLRK